MVAKINGQPVVIVDDSGDLEFLMQEAGLLPEDISEDKEYSDEDEYSAFEDDSEEETRDGNDSEDEDDSDTSEPLETLVDYDNDSEIKINPNLLNIIRDGYPHLVEKDSYVWDLLFGKNVPQTPENIDKGIKTLYLRSFVEIAKECKCFVFDADDEEKGIVPVVKSKDIDSNLLFEDYDSIPEFTYDGDLWQEKAIPFKEFVSKLKLVKD